MSDTHIRGSCLCGAVEFELARGSYHFFQYCHCSRCRKHSGSAHGANILADLAQFAYTKGEDLVKRYEVPDAKAFCTTFCTVCGSAMPWVTRNGKMVIVPAGALDEDPGLKPSRSVYFDSRAPWYAHASELETFGEAP